MGSNLEHWSPALLAASARHLSPTLATIWTTCRIFYIHYNLDCYHSMSSKYSFCEGKTGGCSTESIKRTEKLANKDKLIKNCDNLVYKNKKLGAKFSDVF